MAVSPRPLGRDEEADRDILSRPPDVALAVTSDRLGPYAPDTIHELDCIEAMRRLPDSSCDVAIADPPYNLSKGGNWQWDQSVALPGFGGKWSKTKCEWDDLTLEDYFQFTLSWLQELRRVVKPTGSMWVHGTYHNIGIINFAMQLLGIEILNEVVWYKRNSFPNLAGRRLTASHETILWAHTGGKKREYYFDYDFAKAAHFAEDNLKLAGKQLRTVWDVPNNKEREEIRHGKHPTQKPVRLLTRMLNLTARRDDLVLVPFAGAGSECVAAANLGMRYLGFELEPKYVAIARTRLSAPRQIDAFK